MPCSLNVKETINVLVLWIVLLDVVFTVVSDCSTAQTYHEIMVCEDMGSPKLEAMEQYSMIPHTTYNNTQYIKPKHVKKDE